MPIYEYRCGACGEEEEVIQSVNAEPLTDCPACGKPALKKLVSAAAFHLKGTGWYVTDFRDNDKKKKSAKDEPKASSEAKSDANAGEESKDTSDAKKETNSDAPKKTKGSDSAASA